MNPPVEVAKAHNVSPLKQFMQMLGCMFSQHRLEFHEYYSNQVYRPELTRDNRREYVGERGSYKLNCRLSPLSLTRGRRTFIRDKVLYEAVMHQFGFRATRTQAIVSYDRGYGCLPTLRTVEDIHSFLTERAKYPLFAKPEEGSGSIGSALLTGLNSKDGMLELSNGAQISLDYFASEVLKEYGEGFLFQDAVLQHSELTEIAGRAIGSIRVVTINTGTPEVLYSLWKIPSPKAMSDNYWQAGSMIGALDAETGQLLEVRRGSGPSQETIETHPDSGKPFAGFRIPYWDEVCRMTT